MTHLLSDDAAITKLIPAGKRQLPKSNELSRGEQHILQLMAEGHKTREICDLAHYSEGTVETYRQRAITKLKARSSAHAVAIALRTGLIK